MKAAWAAAFCLAFTPASVFYLAIKFQSPDRRVGAAHLPEPIAVKVVEAPPAAVERRIEVSGHLRPEIELQVVTPVPGTVKEVLYKEGDRVAAGAVVAVVESKELLARLRSAEAAEKTASGDLRDSEARLARAEDQLVNARDLHAKDLIARVEVLESETTVETARAERDLAHSQLEQRKAAVAQLRHLLNLTRITTRTSGVVTRRLVAPGDRVAAAAALVIVADVTVLSFTAEAPELGSVGRWAGSRVEVLAEAFPARRFQGIVTALTGGDASGRKATVKIRVPNPDGLLKPGMKVSAALPSTP